MRVYDFPIAPVLIGLILGPMAETSCGGRWPSARAIPWSSYRPP